MRRLLSDRVMGPAVARRPWLLTGMALLALAMAAPVAAQDTAATPDTSPSATDSLVGAAVSVGSDAAELEVQLSNGRVVSLELDGGTVYVNGESLGTYDRGGSLERSWRDLLEEAAMASTSALPVLLRDWDPPATAGALGRQLDERLEQALEGVGGTLAVVTAPKVQQSVEDSIEELLAQIERLEARGRDRVVYQERSFEDQVLHDFVEGISMLFGTLVFWGVMLALGAALLFFAGGRIERVATTVREEPIRSGLIGLAGTFLFFPFWVLVILALAISVLGIPLILAWMPLFPLLFALAALSGWLAVAYVAGDGLVQGRLRERERFQDASPTIRLAIGIALLLSPFAVAALFEMTSILEGIGMLIFVVGIIANGLAACVGLGAVMARGRDALEDQRMRRRERRLARLQEQESSAQEGTNV